MRKQSLGTHRWAHSEMPLVIVKSTCALWTWRRPAFIYLWNLWRMFWYFWLPYSFTWTVQSLYNWFQKIDKVGLESARAALCHQFRTMMGRSFMHTLGIEPVCFGGLRIGCLVFQIMWSASSKQKRIRTCIRAAEMYFLHWMSGLYLRDRWGAKSSVKGSK